jgi:hypothetical protein
MHSTKLARYIQSHCGSRIQQEFSKHTASPTSEILALHLHTLTLAMAAEKKANSIHHPLVAPSPSPSPSIVGPSHQVTIGQLAVTYLILVDAIFVPVPPLIGSNVGLGLGIPNFNAWAGPLWAGSLHAQRARAGSQILSQTSAAVRV